MSLISSIQGIGGSFLKNLQSPGISAGQDENKGAGISGGLHGIEFAKAQNAIKQLKGMDFSKAPGLVNDLSSQFEQLAPFRAQDSIQGGDFSTTFRPSGGGAPSLPDMFGSLVDSVNQKGADARAETAKLMSGETDNIHQSIIAMQEAGVAFSLLVEVRNKLVDSYKELMRMQV